MPVTSSNAKLLGEYVDIANAHGDDSAQAEEFRQKHAGNKDLMMLITKSKEVRQHFAETASD